MTAIINTVDLSADMTLVAELAELRATIAAAQEREKAVKAALAEKVGEGIGVIDGVEVITVTEIESQRFNSVAFKKIHPDLAEEYTIRYSYKAVKFI